MSSTNLKYIYIQMWCIQLNRLLHIISSHLCRKQYGMKAKPVQEKYSRNLNFLSQLFTDIASPSNEKLETVNLKKGKNIKLRSKDGQES